MSSIKLIITMLSMCSTFISAQVITNKNVINSVNNVESKLNKNINKRYMELSKQLEELQTTLEKAKTNPNIGESEKTELKNEIVRLNNSLSKLNDAEMMTEAKLNSIDSKIDSLLSLSVEEEIIPDTESVDAVETEVGIDEAYITKPAWMRIDGDKDGLSLWFGGSAAFSNLAIEYMILYFPNSNGFEAVVGPYYSFGDGLLDLLPMAGFQYDLAANETSYFLPQLYMYSSIEKFYLEFWNIYSLGTSSVTSDEHLFYGRYIAKYNLTESINFGPQAEISLDLSKGVTNRVSSFIIGGVVGMPFGLEGSFDMFFGIDTKADTNKFNSRFTFIHQI